MGHILIVGKPMCGWSHQSLGKLLHRFAMILLNIPALWWVMGKKPFFYFLQYPTLFKVVTVNYLPISTMLGTSLFLEPKFLSVDII